jgi:hypothetical protein
MYLRIENPNTMTITVHDAFGQVKSLLANPTIEEIIAKYDCELSWLWLMPRLQRLAFPD